MCHPVGPGLKMSKWQCTLYCSPASKRGSVSSCCYNSRSALAPPRTRTASQSTHATLPRRRRRRRRHRPQHYTTTLARSRSRTFASCCSASRLKGQHSSLMNIELALQFSGCCTADVLTIHSYTAIRKLLDLFDLPGLA